MSYTDRVLQAMNFDQEHSVEEVAARASLPIREAADCLRLLAKGGVVECITDHRFRKNRRYRSKQRQIFA